MEFSPGSGYTTVLLLGKLGVGLPKLSNLYNSSMNGKEYSTPIGPEPGASMLGRGDEGEYIFSLADLLRIILRRLWVILLVAGVLTGVAVSFSLVQTPMYEASIKILVGQERGTNEPSIPIYDLQQLTQTMAEGLNSRPVAEATIRQLGLRITPDEFLGNLSVEQVPNTQFIRVGYTDPSPERAQRVANTTGRIFSEQISEVSPMASAITATVWERAEQPDTPVSPDPVRNGLLALMLGLMLGVGLAFFLEYMDDSWDSPEEVEQISGVHTFGVIPEIEVSKGREKRVTRIADSPREIEPHRVPGDAKPNSPDGHAGQLVTVLEPASAASEAYRTLRTNLLYALTDEPPKVIVLTSPSSGEGKSTTCVNLGVVLAQAGRNVLILDCDFRTPAVHRFFGIRNLYGIVDVLAGEYQLQEVWKEPVQGLKFVPVGHIPPNPTEVLSTRRFSELLTSLREEFDYVLVDSPPVGIVSDAAIVATHGDAVLFVLDAQKTRKGSVRQSMRSLEAVGANILGTVMNKVEASKDGYYYDSST